MPSSLKQRLTIVVALVAAAALAGGAYAATQTDRGTTRAAYLADVAKRLGVTPQKLQSALKGAEVDRLSAAVAAGKLTRSQAKALEREIKKSGAVPLGGFGLGAGPRPGFGPGRGFHRGLGGARFGPGGAPRFGPGAGPHFGPGKMLPGFRGRGRRFGAFGPFGIGLGIGFGSALHATTSYLGISPMKLISELHSGRSLAQIAKAHGKTANGLESAIVTRTRTRLDRLVAAKRITAAQERAFLARAGALIGAAINRTPRRPPEGGFWGPFPRADHGPAHGRDHDHTSG